MGRYSSVFAFNCCFCVRKWYFTRQGRGVCHGRHIGLALKGSLVLETVMDWLPCRIGALAMWLGLPKQTVHRIVHQLVNEGLLYKSKSGEGYTVASRLSCLGCRILERAIDEAPVRAILTGQETIGETHIGIDNNDVLYLERRMRLAIADAVAAGQPSAAALHRDRQDVAGVLGISRSKASCLEPAAEALYGKDHYRPGRPAG